MITTLDPITPVGVAPGTIDWGLASGGRSDACDVKVANYSPNALKVGIAGAYHWLEPWMANKFPAACTQHLRYEQLAVSSVAALPAGATPTLIVTVSFGEQIPGIYPVPLYGTLPIDAAAIDIQPVGLTAVAGQIGLAADSGHIHPGRPKYLAPSGGDDTAAINAALKAGPIILGPSSLAFAAATFKITAPLVLGGFDVETLGTVTIQPQTDTFAAFTTAAQLNRFGIRGKLIVDYGFATGGLISANAAAVGFSFTGANSIGLASFKNIEVLWANRGHLDTAGSFLVNLTNVQWNSCANGVRILGGTTFEFVNCYATGATGIAWNLDSVTTCTLVSCAGESSLGGTPFVFRLCHGLTINGFDYEANTTALPTGGLTNRLFTFDNVIGFKCSGISGAGNTLQTTGGFAAVVFLADNCIGVFEGCRFGSGGGSTDTATGTGTAYSVLTDGTADQVSFINCAIDSPIVGVGPPTVVNVQAQNIAAQSLVFVNCKLGAGTINDPGGKIAYLGAGTGLTLGSGPPQRPFQIFLPGVGQFFMDANANLHGDGVLIMAGGVGLDTVGHTHPGGGAGAGNPWHVVNVGAEVTGPASAGTAHTHPYTVATGTTDAHAAPGGESVAHTHKG